MSDVKWIKLAADLFDNDKIILIESLPGGDAAIVLWIKLLCLAGKQNNSGVFQMANGMAYTDKMFAVVLREEECAVRAAFDLFEQFGMIETINGVVTIPGWGEHQSLDKIEKSNKYQQEYMRKYRERQRAIVKSGNDDDADIDIDTEPDTEFDAEANNVADTDNYDISNDDSDNEADAMIDCPNSKPNGKPNSKPNGKPNSKPNGKPNVRDPDKKREEEEDKNISMCDTHTRFRKPTIDEVRAFELEKGYPNCAEQFWNFYESKGWVVGRSPMKNWKCARANWSRLDYNSSQGSSAPQRPQIKYRTEPEMDWEGFDD